MCEHVRFIAVLAMVLVLGAVPGFAQEADSSTPESAVPEKKAERRRGNPVLFYIPNRLFDLTDMVRARIRVGPGLQLGARATRPISANVGMYSAVWIGLHGPRGERYIAWPAGFEAFSGAQASMITVGTDAPHYGATEFGAGCMVLLPGVDVGVDPVEVLDFVLGWLFIDIRKDDL
jgi:hypothetical protein